MPFLEDGFPTFYTFSASGAAQALFKEVEVTPPGIEGGDPINVTTMRNVTWETMAFQKLKTMAESSMSAQYDPKLYTEIDAMINLNQLITLTFPDASELDFWGALTGFTPGTNTRGEMPTADATVIPSNRDNTQAEVDPVFREAPTTTTTTTS